jgi:prophage antirepressor-like protein
MTNLSRFAFQDNQVRVIIIDGQPWFVAADVCNVLSIANSRDALTRLKDYEKDDVAITDAIGRKQYTAVISEPGLYRLILTSRKPQAEPFQDWVCQEVLPQIRKTGKYEAQPKIENIYAHRVQIASKWNIPKGHWCVFHEISLLANKVGLEYPVAEYDLIDGSVGQAWNKYRKCFDWCQETTTFPVTFEDKRDKAHVEAKAYRNSELSYFRDWLENIYTYERLPKYLDYKYGKLLNPQLSINFDKFIS